MTSLEIEVASLHDYVKGAFEALSWVQTLLLDLENNSDAYKKALKEVNDAIEDIKEGIAIDFRRRLKVY